MAISSFKGATSSGGGGADVGFHISVGSTGYTTFTFENEQPAGSYWITSNIANDYVYDLSVASEDGTFAGYTTTRLLNATAPIKNVVIYGATANDLLVFDYKVTATAQISGQINDGVAPYLLSVSDSTLESINDTTTVSGGNFAPDIEIYFVGSDAVNRAAKVITRNSTQQLVVTRPDVLPPEFGPYDLVAINGGIPSPTDGRNILIDAINPGTYSQWITPGIIFWDKGITTALTLQAFDTEATDVDYTIVSGELFPGLTLNSETGVISGDDSSLIELDRRTITFRATDAGGNTTDKTIDIYVNSVPVYSFYFDPFVTAGTLDVPLLYAMNPTGASEFGPKIRP